MNNKKRTINVEPHDIKVYKQDGKHVLEFYEWRNDTGIVVKLRFKHFWWLKLLVRLTKEYAEKRRDEWSEVIDQ